MIWAKRLLIVVGSALVGVYVLWAGLMYGLQDTILFHPGGESREQLDAWATRLGVRPFRVVASDGVELYGWHAPGDGRHALLYFHGNGGSITAVPWLAEQLPGVDVLCVSYRGYPGSEGAPSEAGMKLDALALWAYATETLGFAPDHIVVQGQSLGGGVAHHLLMEAHPAGAVFDSTFSSIEELASASQPLLPVSLLLKHPFRSYERAPRIDVPTLVMHGDDDHLIPVEHGRKLAKLQPNATYVEIPNHGHDAWTLDRPEAQAAWRAFLTRVWGIDIPAPPR
ncbi:MAG: alpha/beta hydrolase [Alphaproteobacteria bacterium]|nr:alpha/beta hydrolase [Alphaproteobacteria bacterium]